MDNEEVLKRLSELPRSIRDHLFSDAIGDLNGEIIARNGIAGGQRDALFSIIRELIAQALTTDGLVGELQKRLSLDAEKAKKLAADIAGYRLLPMDKYLGDIDGYIRGLGGDPAVYPPTRIKIEERTVDEASDEVAASVGANAFEHRMKERLKDITESFLKSVRTEAQVMETLQRSAKTGGMEFTARQAQRVLDGMKEELKAVRLVEEKKAAAAAPASASAPAAPARKKDDFATITPEDEREIADIRAGVLPAKVAPQSAQTAANIAASIDALYAASGAVPQDEDLQKRLKTIIGNRLRDVRDPLETLEALVQPKELGGMSMKTDDARRLVGLIEAKLKEVHAAHAQETNAGKAEWVMAEEQKKVEKEAAGQAKEARELETLFRSVVAKSPKAAAKAAAMPPLAMPAPAPQPMPVAAPAAMPPAPRPAPPPAPPPVQPAGMPPVNLPFTEPPKAPPPPPPAAIQPPKPTVMRPAMPPAPPVRPVMPASVVRPAAPAVVPKPKMEDIRAASPRLTGPVEELRATTLADFRRLSKDPKEAGLKIKDKVDLLADQSYDKRNDGIKAWGESEVSRTYVDQMREALDGKPMPQVIADRQAAKQPHLSLEEMAAVAELNRQMRY